jgi:hypothetical protein
MAVLRPRQACGNREGKDRETDGVYLHSGCFNEMVASVVFLFLNSQGKGRRL